MSENWYILRADVKYGPYPVAQMQEMLRAGQLLPSDQVQKDGVSQWQPISAISVMGTSVPPPPPLPWTPGLLQRFLGIWRRQSVLGKLGLVLGAICGLLQALEWVGTRLGVVSTDGGGNTLLTFWAFMKNTGVVGGLTTFCWECLKTKLYESSQGASGVVGDSPVPSPRPASGIRFQNGGEEKEFAGLNFQQWFVTLTILFLTLLVTGAVTAVATVRSVWWVAWPSQVVVGLLLVYMNVVALRDTNFDSRLGMLVGLSPLIFVVVWFGCGWMLFSAGVHSVEGPAWLGWGMVVYGIVAFLPAYRLFELVAPGTPPIRQSAGSWLSVAYLALVVVLGVVIPLMADGKSDPYGINESRQRLATAEKLWDAGKKTEAIKEYKVCLKSKGRIHFRSELPGVYRRVIEYEAENGDGGEARDWALRALDEWSGQMQLSFQSPKARAIWAEVEEEYRRREEKQREQWQKGNKQSGKRGGR